MEDEHDADAHASDADGDADGEPHLPTVDALQSPDVLAGIMSQLGLGHANRAARVCVAWLHAALALQDEQRVLRPSHSLGWGNQTLSQFRSPSGIIPLPSGDLCVADTNNHRLQVLSRSGEVRCIFGQGPGGGVGEFQQPTGLACDGDALYVADSGNCRLHKLALPHGEVTSTVGVFGEMPGQLHAPVGLALYAGRLFCADSRNHRISVFTTAPTLRYLMSFCSFGSGEAELGSTSSGIYIAAYEGEVYIADRSNHRLQVLSVDGAFRRTIGRRGTAPGCFRRLRGVAASEGRLFTAECERVQVLTLTGTPLQVLPLPGSTALVGICADPSHVCVVDQTHQKVRVLSFCQDEGRGAAFGPPQLGEPHLRPFLLPTAVCDCDAPEIVALSRRLIPQGCSAARAAAAVRAWVRTHIRYTLQDKSDLASATLAKREGMCTNKANLQCALLRAAGVPAGYVMLHITKAAFDSPFLLAEVAQLISPITIHIFCAVYIPFAPSAASAAGDGAEWSELGCFRHYDATERAGATHLTEYVPYSDETRFRKQWQRGPFTPVQSNLDHLLTPGSKIPEHLIEEQNELYRAHPI